MAKRKKKDRGQRPQQGSEPEAPSQGKQPKQAKQGKQRKRPGDSTSSPGHEIAVPTWLPWLLYAGVTLFLFREFVVSDDMLFGGDTLSLGYMARAFYADMLRAGEFPLWNPIILGGTPFLDSLAGGDSLYPPSALLLALIEPYRSLGWKLVLHVFAAGPLMALWVRSLGVSRASAVVCGLAYMVAPFFVALAYPGHDGKMFVTALAPLAFWAAERALAQGGLGRYAAMSVVIGLVLLTTHFQMAYFLFGSMGVYAVFRSIQLARIGGGWPQAGGRFALFLAASLLGAGISAVQLLPAVSYVNEFSRRTATTTEAQSQEEALAYGASYSLHPEEAMSLIVPEFVGGNVDGSDWTNGTYWGRNGFKSNHEYMGWVILLLAGLSFFGAPRRGLRLLLFGLGTVALLFALGRTTPIWRLFYEAVPGISYFRAPSQAIFVTGFAWITLAGFGLDQGLRLFASTGRTSGETEKRAGRSEKALWGVAGGLGLLTVLWVAGILESVWTSALFRDMVDRQADALVRARPFIAQGFFLATALALAVAAVWTAAKRSWLGPAAIVAVLGGLVVVDGVRVDQPYVQTFDFQQWSRPDPNVQFLTQRLDEAEPWRLLSMMPPQPGQDVGPGMHGIELAGGHHPNDLGRYRELVGMVGSQPPMNLIQNPRLLSLLNVRYLLWPEAQFGAVAQLGPAFQGLTAVNEVKLNDGRTYSALYELPTLPRARLVGSARVVPEDQAVATMMDASFDPNREVVLSEAPPVALDGSGGGGSVTWTSRGPNRGVMQVTSDGPALLVVSDNWYPAWKATVNGNEAPVLRAYHTLRAIPVEAGTSTVDMFYDTAGLSRGLWTSFVSLLLAIAALVHGFVSGRKARAEGPDFAE